MYAKFAHLKLPQHYHIRLDREFKQDCQVWIQFLETGVRSLCRPFIDLDEKLNAEVLDFYSDAAKGRELGMGAVFGSHWLFTRCETGYIKRFDPSIEYLELLGVITAVYAWSEQLMNKRIVLFCDNQSVVEMINSTSSSCGNCMVLIRLLTIRSLIFNIRVFCRWVSGKINWQADFLSRQKIQQFQDKSKQENLEIDELPTELPKELWPASKIWVGN